MTEALVDHLWQSTLFLLAAALLTSLFQRDRASVRFRIWMAASLKFLVPFSLLILLGRHFASHPGSADSAALQVPVVMQAVARPGGTLPVSGQTLALTLWTAGFLVVVRRRLRQWRRVRTLVRAASPLCLPAPIPVRQTDAALEPALWGIFRPVLLLPKSVVGNLPPSQLQTVLAHELCHWRRRDNLTAALHMLVEALFWFHPLVWWLGSRLIIERERACDEAVIESGGDRQTYAQSILTVCRLHLEPPRRHTAAISGGHLRQRIEAIMTKPSVPRLSLPKQVLLVTAAMGSLAAPVLLGLAAGRPARAQDAATEPAPSSSLPPRIVKADILEIAETVSQATGRNFVIDPRLQGPVTMTVTEPVTARSIYQGFLALLKTKGYRAERAPDSGVIQIVRDEGPASGGDTAPAPPAEAQPSTAPGLPRSLPAREAHSPAETAGLAPLRRELRLASTDLPDPQRPTALVVTHVEPPLYPAAAVAGNLTGEVLAQFTVLEDGTTADIAILSAEPSGVFEQVATDAIRQWRYEPPVLQDGTPTHVTVQTSLRFKP